MSLRIAKQIIYAAFYIIIWVIVIGTVYVWFIKPTPSCFDNIQNQGEQGVDCGGPCAKICTTSAQEITVLSLNTFVSSPGHDTFLAQVANANSGFAAQDFSYSFDLYDASGTLITSIPGQSFLYAQQVKYLLLPNVAVPNSIARAALTIGTAHWVAGAVLGMIPQFSFQNIGTQLSSSTVSVNGQIENQDTATFGNILVIAILKDANHNPIGASQTEINGISPNEIQNFSVSYPAPQNVNPAATEVEAYGLRN